MLTIATKVITIIAFVNVEPLGYAMILEEKVEAGQAFVPRETTFPSPLIPNRKNVPTLPMMKETFDPPTTMLNDIEMVEARIDKTRVKEQDDSVRFVSQSNVNSTHAPTSTEMVKATRIKVKRRIKRKVKIPIKEREISRKIASRPMLKTTIPPTAARKPSGKGEVDFKHATMPRIKLTLPPMLLITALPPAATTKVPTAPPLRFVPTFNLMFQTADPIKKHVATSLNFKVTTPPHATEESVSLQPEDSVTDARLMIISTEPESEQDFVATGTLQNFEVTEPPSAIEESVSLPPLKMSSKEPKIDKFVPTFPPMFFVNTPDHTAKEIVTPFAADSPTETNFETSTGPNNGRFIPLLYQNDNSRTTESPTEGVMTPLSADNDADVNSVVQMVEPDTGAANASKGFELLMSDGMTEAGDGVNTATSNSEGNTTMTII